MTDRRTALGALAAPWLVPHAATADAPPPPLPALPTPTADLASLRAGHPRLIVTPELEASLRARLKTDALLARFIERIAKHSDLLAAAPPVPFQAIPFEKFGIQMLPTSRAILARVVVHGLLYRLHGERRYAERMWRDIDTALGYETWNPAHFLDAAEMTLAVALAYDWAFSEWTDEQRSRMRTAMKERCLLPGLQVHIEGQKSWLRATSNWNSVCNTGLLAGSLAMAEDEPQLARDLLARCVPSLAYPRSSYEPDGGTDEGPSYWGYGTDFFCLARHILVSALGTEAHLLDGPGMAGTVLYRVHVQAPNGRNYAYADAWPRSGPSMAYAFLAGRHGPPPACAHVRELTDELGLRLGKDDGERLGPLIALWLPPAPTGREAPVPLDAFFHGVSHLAMMRGAWGDPQAPYVGFKAGTADHSHCHLDLGSFNFDQAGVRWVADLGVESYSLPGYFRKETDANNRLTAENAHLPHRWTYFRLINQGHSTLTLGDQLQDRKAVAPFTATGSAPKRGFAVADLSSVYPTQARGWQRGIALVDRRWLAVRDELQGLKPGAQVDWVLLTEARQVRIAADGRSAVLETGAKRLLLRLAQAPASARLTAAPAKPPTPQENQNEGITRIVLSWAAQDADAQLEVHLVPQPAKGRTALQGPLKGWQA